MTQNKEEPEIPTAAAVAVDEASPTPTATAGGATAAATDCANFFKNPTEAMRAQAVNQALGGVLFIESPGKKGKFTLAKSITVGRVLGDDKIDLSYADFVHPVTTINCGGVIQSLKITVPSGVRVEAHGLGLLGTFTGLESQTIHAAQDGPTVVVKGFTILGSVKVKLNESCPAVRIVE